MAIYNDRRSKRISPSAVPLVILRNEGITQEDIDSWKERGLIKVLRTINDNIIKPIRQ